MTKPIVEFNNVSIKFRNEPVLSKINLTVNENDFLALIGPNGAGKTTILKSILGIFSPHDGVINVFDKDVSSNQNYIRTRTGYVPQHTPYNMKNFPGTITETVLTGITSQKDKIQNLSNVLEFVDLLDIKNKRISELSGGQIQRTFIARAMISEPDLLLLDEPTSNIDVDSQGLLFRSLEKIKNDRDITVIFSSHDTMAVSNLSSKVACINKKIDFHGNPDDFFSNKHLAESYGYSVKFIEHSKHSD